MSNVQRAIAVLGTTGSGKSSLAVKLAQSLPHSPILSCDSIQLYGGLDVITNKATAREQGGVEHWGLSLSEPWEPSWELGRFINAATAKLSSLPPGTVPILAGGTHYWLQHLLFPPPELDTSRVRKREERWAPKGPPPPNDLQGEWKTLLDTFHGDAVYPKGRADEDWRKLSVWRLLEMVDPNEARRWHWRDTRKVVTALQRWYDSATPPSTSSPSASSATTAGLRPRFPQTLLFWVYEPLPTLKPRLNARVDSMVSRGLLNEIRHLRALAQDLHIPTTGGIFEAIGFREFNGVDVGNEVQVEEALRRVKKNTHTYARSQLKWIRNQLLPAAREAGTHGDVRVLVVPPSGEGAVQAMHRELFPLTLFFRHRRQRRSKSAWELCNVWRNDGLRTAWERCNVWHNGRRTAWELCNAWHNGRTAGELCNVWHNGRSLGALQLWHDGRSLGALQCAAQRSKLGSSALCSTTVEAWEQG